MKHVRVFLSLALAAALLGSGVRLPVSPGAAGDSAARAAGPVGAPTGLTPSEWQAIQAQVAKLTAADGAAGDSFGRSVSVSGDTAVVGADAADVGGNGGQGAAYVFYRDQGGPDAWGQVAKLTASDGAAGDGFGLSVSVGGDTAVIGAFYADVGGNANQGAAYVFYRDRGGADAWGQVAKLTAADGAQSDHFAQSVSISGDTSRVGDYPSSASPYGALDMAGNVYEWVNDWYQSNYCSQSPYENPPGPPSGSYKVLRGGGWGSYWDYVRVAHRNRNGPDFRDSGVGFRCGASPGG